MKEMGPGPARNFLWLPVPVLLILNSQLEAELNYLPQT